MINGVVGIRASVSCCRRRKWADIHAAGGGDDHAMFQRVVATEAGSQRAASPEKGGGGQRSPDEVSSAASVAHRTQPSATSLASLRRSAAQRERAGRCAALNVTQTNDGL